MANTGTPTIKRGGSVAPVRSMSKSDTRVIVSFSVGVYATGGNPLTQPSDVAGLDLIGVKILNPTPDVTADVMFGWNGSISAPKITAKVISTAAQVANAVDLSAHTLIVELIYGG